MSINKPFEAEHGFDANDKLITNVADPIADTDAVNKKYSSNASNLTTGMVDINLIGDPNSTRDETTYLCGDNTWVSIPLPSGNIRDVELSSNFNESAIFLGNDLCWVNVTIPASTGSSGSGNVSDPLKANVAGQVFTAPINFRGNLTTTQSTNTLYGEGATFSSTAATDNTGIGNNVLKSISGLGKQNTIIGSQAGQYITTGSNNILIGYNSGVVVSNISAMTTENDTICIGTNSYGRSSAIAIGQNARGIGTGSIAIGLNACSNSTSSVINCIAIGQNTLLGCSSADNIGIGVNALLNIAGFAPNNVAIGSNSQRGVLSGGDNTSIGYNSLNSTTTTSNPTSNTAIGAYALASVTGNGNTVIGKNSALSTTTGRSNIAIGMESLRYNTIGTYNVAIGVDSMYNPIDTNYNVAIGYSAFSGTHAHGDSNIAIGREALSTNSGGWNTSIGSYSMSPNSDTNHIACTAIGYNALRWYSADLFNSTAIGYDAVVTDSNQVQLGNSATTTYVYGTVQNRSDLRDKTEVRDTLLGLDFIKSLRPVDFKWNYREDYNSIVTSTEQYEEKIPIETIVNFLSEDGTMQQKIDTSFEIHYKIKEVEKLVQLPNDGSKTRSRYHHGLIAQEVKSAIDSIGIDFGGFQDHSINGGSDVLTIGYDELIAPLIKAVQELAAKNLELESKLNEVIFNGNK